MKKILSLAMVLILLFGSLISCTDTEGGQKATDIGTETKEVASADVPLIQNGSAVITIAYAKDELKNVKTSISLIQSVFSQHFGVEIANGVKWDAATMADRPCIVFGNIGDEISESIYGGLKSMDYSVSVHDKRIYISAWSSDTYALATNTMLLYLKELVGESTEVRELSMKGDYSLCYNGKYSFGEVCVEEKDMKELVILEPADSSIPKSFADTLESKLFEAYGFPISSQIKEDDGKNYIKMEIDHGMDPLHYGYRVENGDLIIVSGGAYSMKYAVQDIVSLLRPDNTATKLLFRNGDNRSVSLLDNPNGLQKPVNSNLRVMSSNMTASFDGWDSGSAAKGYTLEMRGEIFESYLKVYDPDVVGMQEVCNNWHAYLNERYDENSPWRIVTGGGTRIYFLNPIMYRSDRYRLIEEGRTDMSVGDSMAWGGRYMCWAALESIATGERFVLINTHLTGSEKNLEQNLTQMRELAAKIRELKARFNCPVMTTGDYNTYDFIPSLRGDATVPNPDISDQSYTELLSDGTVKDAKFYTDVQVNEIGSVHTWGATAFPRTFSYDHIFVTSDTTVRQFYTAWDNHQQWLSDHAFLIADVDLTVKKVSS